MGGGGSKNKKGGKKDGKPEKPNSPRKPVRFEGRIHILGTKHISFCWLQQEAKLCGGNTKNPQNEPSSSRTFSGSFLTRLFVRHKRFWAANLLFACDVDTNGRLEAIHQRKCCCAGSRVQRVRISLKEWIISGKKQYLSGSDGRWMIRWRRFLCSLLLGTSGLEHRFYLLLCTLYIVLAGRCVFRLMVCSLIRLTIISVTYTLNTFNLVRSKEIHVFGRYGFVFGPLWDRSVGTAFILSQWAHLMQTHYLFI